MNMSERWSDPKPSALVIDSDTSVSGRIRIQPDGKDEFTLELGWMRLDDLIAILARIQTVR